MSANPDPADELAAELASMKVYQEIDALETMNIPPAKVLVLPRLAAVLVMMPVLTIIANLVGWFGGALEAFELAGDKRQSLKVQISFNPEVLAS